MKKRKMLMVVLLALLLAGGMVLASCGSSCPVAGATCNTYMEYTIGTDLGYFKTATCGTSSCQVKIGNTFASKCNC